MKKSKDISSLVPQEEAIDASLLQNDTGNQINYRKFWKIINDIYFKKRISQKFPLLSLQLDKFTNYSNLSYSFISPFLLHLTLLFLDPSDFPAKTKSFLFSKKFTQFLHQLEEEAALSKLNLLYIYNSFY